MNAVARIMEPPPLDTVEMGTVAILAKSEIDQQIATAHRYPRSIQRFREEVQAMATLNEGVAAECSYAVPREGKTIEGPSARFAEIVASAWGNSRAGARIVAEDDRFVTAQGVFHDLQKNVAITYEVRRRITTKHGKKFGDDMVSVTGNAAASIALRNAILKGVPKAFWQDLWEESRRVAAGEHRPMANRRAEAMKAMQRFNVTPQQVLDHFEIKGEPDLTPEHLERLRGYIVAFRDGDVEPETVFAPIKREKVTPPPAGTAKPLPPELPDIPPHLDRRPKRTDEAAAAEAAPADGGDFPGDR